jgi:hypothetical protein
MQTRSAPLLTKRSGSVTDNSGRPVDETASPRSSRKREFAILRALTWSNYRRQAGWVSADFPLSEAPHLPRCFETIPWSRPAALAPHAENSASHPIAPRNAACGLDGSASKVRLNQNFSFLRPGFSRADPLCNPVKTQPSRLVAYHSPSHTTPIMIGRKTLAEPRPLSSRPL